MKKNLLLATILSIMTSTTFADGITAARAFNDKVHSFSGSFSQTVKNAKKTQNSSGTFAILRPGYFKWEYAKPSDQLIIGDGKTIWQYDRDLAQIVRRPQQAALGSSPAAILSDKSSMEKNYSLKDDGQEGGIDYVAAEPKSKDTAYRHIRLGFKNGQLSIMQLEDSFGNFITIRFDSMNLNPGLTSSTFRFTPPKGVDVLTAD